ncbi:MAG: 16S rRNA (guanine(966)-N(2))-methyltransferase RsmD [Nitriliruptoraceae bacterium]
MRIIAGTARGRRLRVPDGAGVRPTADRVRESLFSSLQQRVAGADVLDLYAGAGGLGLEAASRGAERVTLVERDPRVAEVLRANVAVVGATQVRVVVRDVVAHLQRDADHAHDLVFIDPPYDTSGADVDHLLRLLCEHGHLAPEAHVVVERSRRSEVPNWPACLSARRPRRYGDTMLHRADHVDPDAEADPTRASTEVPT